MSIPAAVLVEHHAQRQRDREQDARDVRDLRERMARAALGADLERLRGLFERLPDGERRSVESLAHWLCRARGCDACARRDRLPADLAHNGSVERARLLVGILAKPGGSIGVDPWSGEVVVRRPDEPVSAFGIQDAAAGRRVAARG